MAGWWERARRAGVAFGSWATKAGARAACMVLVAGSSSLGAIINERGALTHRRVEIVLHDLQSAELFGLSVTHGFADVSALAQSRDSNSTISNHTTKGSPRQEYLCGTVDVGLSQSVEVLSSTMNISFSVEVIACVASHVASRRVKAFVLTSNNC